MSSRSVARRSAMVAVGALAMGGLATLPVLSASATSDSPAAVAATGAVAPAAKTKKPTPKKTTITTKKCATKKKNGAVTCKTIKKTVKVRPTGPSSTTTKPTDPSSTTTKPTGPITTAPAESHVENPFVGSKGYVNPEWSAKAKKDGAPASIYNQPTAIWLDRIAAIEGTANSQSNGPMGVEDHLDAALQQSGGERTRVMFVVYDLPGRDCAALSSNGELKATEIDRYKTEYIDAISKYVNSPKYASLRIVLIIEPDSLPNLTTNQSMPNCATMISNGNYEKGVAYALEKLTSTSNVYTYVDAGHHGWLGWDTNLGPAAKKFADVAKMTAKGVSSVDGFIVNTANYSALEEPYLNPVTKMIGSDPLRKSKFLDWNFFSDEKTFALGLKSELEKNGFGSGLGMLIDTSRNGWGGAKRPKAASTSTNVDTYAEESRMDRRIHVGNWCNQAGAGLGERPTAAPAAGIDAYVWVKPPGESDGSSKFIPNDEGRGFDGMCDPTYTGNTLNQNHMSGALPDAPLAGAWFSAQFKELLANAYPAVS
ncbi:MAG: glycoside hydrolase family 6 protein [Kineosporiaceae bacterium]